MRFPKPVDPKTKLSVMVIPDIWQTEPVLISADVMYSQIIYDNFHLRSENVRQKNHNTVSFLLFNYGLFCVAFHVNIIVRYLKLSMKIAVRIQIKKEKGKPTKKSQFFDGHNSRFLRPNFYCFKNHIFFVQIIILL